MSVDGSSRSHQPLFIWIPSFRGRKAFHQPLFCLGNPTLPLSHSLVLWLGHMVVIHFLEIQAMFVFLLHFFLLLYIYGAVFSLPPFSLFLFSSSCVDINWNNAAVIDLPRAFRTFLAGAGNELLPGQKNTVRIQIASSMISPNTLKHFNSARAFHRIQILNKAGRICGWLCECVCFFTSSGQAFDFHLNTTSNPLERNAPDFLILWPRFFSHSVSPLCFPECYTANGEDYRGLQNQTSLHGGKPCLFWNETFQHPYNTLKYPNGEGGLGSHNYCRWVRLAHWWCDFMWPRVWLLKQRTHDDDRQTGAWVLRSNR